MKQVRLLQLWDELGFPHDLLKQEHGERLTIIGLDVDTRNMTISMPLQARSDLLTALRDFAHVGQRRPLQEFQRLAGWLNWSLNAYPLLRLGMSMLYSKMSGNHAPISLSGLVPLYLENSPGLRTMLRPPTVSISSPPAAGTREMLI